MSRHGYSCDGDCTESKPSLANKPVTNYPTDGEPMLIGPWIQEKWTRVREWAVFADQRRRGVKGLERVDNKRQLKKMQAEMRDLRAKRAAQQRKMDEARRYRDILVEFGVRDGDVEDLWIYLNGDMHYTTMYLPPDRRAKFYSRARVFADAQDNVNYLGREFVDNLLKEFKENVSDIYKELDRNMLARVMAGGSGVFLPSQSFGFRTMSEEECRRLAEEAHGKGERRTGWVGVVCRWLGCPI